MVGRDLGQASQLHAHMLLRPDPPNSGLAHKLRQRTQPATLSTSEQGAEVSEGHIYPPIIRDGLIRSDCLTSSRGGFHLCPRARPCWVCIATQSG
jgi:hypothetical protein